MNTYMVIFQSGLTQGMRLLQPFHVFALENLGLKNVSTVLIPKIAKLLFAINTGCSIVYIGENA